MPKLFALADLHLSLSGEKPMDVFGDLWLDHAPRMAEAWDATVEDDDTVLVPGDISWARHLADAKQDLAWLGERPGAKILLRGNHDSWWTSVSKLRTALPPCCRPLQNNSFEIGAWVVVGARGWTAPGDPMAMSGDEAVFRRELERLRLSIADADRCFGGGRPRIAMLHFPPWLVGQQPTEVVSDLRASGVRQCVYGHLHGEDHRLAMTGEHDGIRYHFVACDAVGFSPALIIEDTDELPTWEPTT